MTIWQIESAINQAQVKFKKSKHILLIIFDYIGYLRKNIDWVEKYFRKDSDLCQALRNITDLAAKNTDLSVKNTDLSMKNTELAVKNTDLAVANKGLEKDLVSSLFILEHVLLIHLSRIWNFRLKLSINIISFGII